MLRVTEGGHNVPEQDIRRRFVRPWDNFRDVYRDLADAWVVFDTSEREPRIEQESR